MKLTREDITHLAELSKLALTEDEIKRAESELTAIVHFVERISAVDTAGVEPFTMPLRDEWRMDIAMPCSEQVRQGILNNFPERQGNALKTPGVFAHPKGK